MPNFDLQKTAILAQLFQVPRRARDAAWSAAFLDAVPEASFAAGSPQVSVGPDGFPYFILRMPPAGAPFESFCVNHILDGALV